MYKEIEYISKCGQYCLAGKKGYTKQGGANLRGGVSFEADTSKKDPEVLRQQAKILYDWINLPQSRLRMLISWQASGGLAFVSGVHLLGMQCFLKLGNSKHDAAGDIVSLEDFQELIVHRHEMEVGGNEYLQQVKTYAADFA